MRALHVSTHFSLYTSTLLNGAPRGRDFAFLQRENYHSELADDPPANVRLFQKAGPRKPFTLARTTLELRAWLRLIKPTVVHFQETPTVQCLAFWRACSDFPRVLTVHDVTPHPGRDAGSRRGRRYTHIMRAEAEAIVVHADALRSCLTETDHTRQAVHVIEHPALPLRPGPIPSDLHGPYALMVGRMEAYKGLETLLDAWAGFTQNQAPSLRLVLAGSGPELDRLEKRFQALPGTLIINRFLSRQEMDGLVSSSALLIAPYLEASASGVLAQSLTAGVPAIATRTGAFGEYIVDGCTGWLVPPGDAEALQAVLARIGAQPALASDARTEVAVAAKTRFSAERISQRTAAAYEDAIEIKQLARTR